MHSTHLRFQHIHGLMLGVALGDALGFAREGLARRAGLKMYGRPPLRFRLLPGCGIYSDDTQLMLMAAQAMVQSRSDVRAFRRTYQKRLSWYLLSLPVGIGRGTLIASCKAWFFRTGLATGVHSAGNGAATRALFCALAIQGNGQRLRSWIQESTTITHLDPRAVDGCQVLARLAEIGATTPLDEFDPLRVLKQAIEFSREAELRDGLSQLVPFLEQGRSPASVARYFGWRHGISGFIVPTTILSTYCWLRYPQDYCRAVESAITLGGDSDSLGAIVGGLVGAHIGSNRLPERLVKKLAGYPHGRDWMERMAIRLSHWPHGVDDLSYAPPLPTRPASQLLRNLLTIPLVLGHVVARIPFQLLARSRPRR